MELSTIIKIWITLVGFSFGISEIFQIINIRKNLSSKGISLTTWWIMIFGQFQWLLYGIYIMDIPVIVTNIFCVLISLILITTIYIYRYKKL